MSKNSIVESLDFAEVLARDARADGMKFVEKGNKAAGSRARLHLAALANLCKQVRADIQEKKNAEKK